MTINNKQIEFGLDTFGDLAFDDQTHQRISYSQSLEILLQKESWPMKSVSISSH